MKIFYIFLTLLCFALHVSATNITVSGNISANTTWNTDTVFVNGDVIIDGAVTVTINPGVVVIFLDNYDIFVSGTLLAVGSQSSPIVFTAADSTGFATQTHLGWNGIHFDHESYPIDGDTSKFVFCEFSYGNSDYGTIAVLHYSKVIVDQCLFHHNYTGDAGAAMTISDSSDIVVKRSVFEYNYSYYGGAIEVNCDGSGSYSMPVIENCQFYNNICLSTYTYYGGAAIKLSGYTKARVINCKIIGNSCINGSGGGGVLISGYSSPVLMNNIIAENHSRYNGGGVMIRYYTNPALINNTIINNHCDSMGGGVGVGCSTDTLRLINNIIYGNTSAHGSQVFINNDDSCKAFQILNNLIEGGTAFELGDTGRFSPVMVANIDADPMINDFNTFHAAPCSPIFDAGTSLIPLPPFDFYYQPRIFGSEIDLGAIERQIPVNIISNDSLQFCIGDSIEYNGNWYTSSTVITDTFAGVQYCDSIIIMNIVAVDCSSLNDLSNLVTVFPNPSNGVIQISISNFIGNEIISFFDLAGREFMTVKLSEPLQTIVLPDNFSGLLFYRIEGENGHIANGRLVVE